MNVVGRNIRRSLTLPQWAPAAKVMRTFELAATDDDGHVEIHDLFGLRPTRRRVMTRPRNRTGPRIPVSSVESTVARPRVNGSRNGPAPKVGPTKSSSPPASNARSPPGNPTAARSASAPHGSRRARRSRSSTSSPTHPSNATHRAPRRARLRRRTTTSCSSGRPGPAKPTSRSGSRSGPAKPATASRSRPPPNGSPASATRHAGRLHDELRRLGRYPVLVVDEVGYIPFEAEAANLFFQLVTSRYERAAVIVTSNKPFGRWGEVFGDAVVAAAMIDRLVHHAEVVSLKGDSYRLKDRDLGRVPNDDTP